MGEDSKIQWCHHSFNPWTGCARVSPGCEHCYAETLSKRAPKTFGAWGHSAERRVTSDANWRKPLAWDRKAAEAGERHRVFCASLADVFEDRPELIEPRVRLFALIEQTPNLDWLLLTKRAREARDFMTAYARGEAGPAFRPLGVPANVWIGVSVEDQRRADERIPLLLDTPAAIRFLSCEPLLGDVDLSPWLGGCSCGVGDLPSMVGGTHAGECSEWSTGLLNWAIVGGESGTGARPMDLAWARAIVEQCQAAGVATFVKQIGARPALALTDEAIPYVLSVGHHIEAQRASLRLRDAKGGDPDQWPEDLRVREFPRAA